jgi:hypothetical protein
VLLQARSGPAHPLAGAQALVQEKFASAVKDPNIRTVEMILPPCSEFSEVTNPPYHFSCAQARAPTSLGVAVLKDIEREDIGAGPEAGGRKEPGKLRDLDEVDRTNFR